ncbi:MAG: hypothetical protein HY873_13100 [Chloroflexi bacterium]|nr:hypothetical protein [Chloroflexota bacterium]
MGKPRELEQAEMVEAIAVRYHKLPSEVLAAPVSNLRHLRLLKLGAGEGD